MSVGHAESQACNCESGPICATILKNPYATTRIGRRVLSCPGVKR